MDRIRFKINDVDYSVGSEISSDVTLLDYIREYAQLRGTKYMCREAGCGACIVSVVKSEDSLPMSVNSCMVSVTSCQFWEITTIEKVGNKLDGYHPLQKTLAKENGTQCGYCTPGWIMAMYSLLSSKKDQLTMLEIEKSFGSNICRCTGYRPILDAFKKFASDAPELVDIPDIEDVHVCKKSGRKCSTEGKCNNESWCFVSDKHITESDIVEIKLKDGKKWFKVLTVNDVFSVLDKEGYDSYMLVAGNTAKGAYPIDEYPNTLIDISDVRELQGHTIDQNLVIGAGSTLSETLTIFKDVAQQQNFEYLEKFYEHMNLVAHIPVRNIGTIAGNLMTKLKHKHFPSDMFLLFETVGVQLSIKNSEGKESLVTMQEFLNLNPKGLIILKVYLPPLNSDYYDLVIFKILPRAQSVHAIINAGFLYKIDKKDNKVIEATIAIGGLSQSFLRATKTETFLVGKVLFNNTTLQSAIEILNKEIVAEENPPEPSANYRKQLAINLFYKGLMILCPDNILANRYRSGRSKLHEERSLSKGIQKFDTDRTLWPLNEPVQKIEAMIQCSGEAMYTDDLPSIPQQVFASLVLSTVATGTIVDIDPSSALKQPGVIAFYSAKDIPGRNSSVPIFTILSTLSEEIFCSKAIEYFNQPVGVIVAESRYLADKAAKLVKVNVRNVRKPVTDVKDAKEHVYRNLPYFVQPPTIRGLIVDKIIKNENAIYGQYHFCMETLASVAAPSEDGLNLHCSTQWVNGVQATVAKALDLNCNQVDVQVPRVGGGYGMKLTRAGLGAAVSSLVAMKLNRPCRLIPSLTTVTRAIGKRWPCASDYEIGVSSSGKIQYLTLKMYQDSGYKISDVTSVLLLDNYYNCYSHTTWFFSVFDTITDTPKNTWCRGPGTLEGTAISELMMENISYELNLDPFEVRLKNLDVLYQKDLTEMATKIKSDSQYAERKANVLKFNKENRWKKRGIRVSFMKFTPLFGFLQNVTVNIYHNDGTVSITHSGVEIGQGINTKAAQVCAHLLGIPLDKVAIKRLDTIITPNGFGTGNSVTSQDICIAVTRACRQLLERLEPIRKQLQEPSWVELIHKAYASGVDLQVQGSCTPLDIQLSSIYGITVAEVEVDILTGEHEILRVDLLEDVGRSISPWVDVGQLEGAFIMGLGYWTMEELVYNKDTGELLTDRAWNYTVPQSRDIPQDFRIYFRENSYTTDALYGSKATGEPSICMAIAIPFAIREAIAAARLETGIPTTKWFKIDGPHTLEKICMAANTNYKDFKFS